MLDESEESLLESSAEDGERGAEGKARDSAWFTEAGLEGDENEELPLGSSAVGGEGGTDDESAWVTEAMLEGDEESGQGERALVGPSSIPPRAAQKVAARW